MSWWYAAMNNFIIFFSHPSRLAVYHQQSPSPAMAKMGGALRSLLLSDSNGCLKDRKVSGKLIRKCAPGIELVDWLVNLSPVVHTRIQATGMWQALLEEGVISHGNCNIQFAPISLACPFTTQSIHSLINLLSHAFVSSCPWTAVQRQSFPLSISFGRGGKWGGNADIWWREQC